MKKNKDKDDDSANNIHLIQVRVEKSKAVEEARQMRSYADKLEVERDRLRWEEDRYEVDNCDWYRVENESLMEELAVVGSRLEPDYGRRDVSCG